MELRVDIMLFVKGKASISIGNLFQATSKLGYNEYL